MNLFNSGAEAQLPDLPLQRGVGGVDVPPQRHDLVLDPRPPMIEPADVRGGTGLEEQAQPAREHVRMEGARVRVKVTEPNDLRQQRPRPQEVCPVGGIWQHAQRIEIDPRHQR